ncbi:hypothetical protein BJX96DRAFT_82685 [Aspergillus floccosus]
MRLPSLFISVQSMVVLRCLSMATSFGMILPSLPYYIPGTEQPAQNHWLEGAGLEPGIVPRQEYIAVHSVNLKIPAMLWSRRRRALIQSAIPGLS